MPEVSCVGHARVEAVETCLVFYRWGNSSVRMVTGTFAHSEGLCGDLKLKGESQPLGVTPGHPFWSADREDWVSVEALRPGDTVKTLQGTTTVESFTMREKPEPTFNMEVEGDHVYRVGEQGILVHNASDPCSKVGVTTTGPDGAVYSTKKLLLEWPDGVERDYNLAQQVVALVMIQAGGDYASDAIKDVYRKPVRFIRPRPGGGQVPPAGMRSDWFGRSDGKDTAGHIIPRIAGGRITADTTENGVPQNAARFSPYGEFTEWLRQRMSDMGKPEDVKERLRAKGIIVPCRICVQWDLDYDDRDYPFRPSKIIAQVWLDGNFSMKWEDPN
jgi:hypothetical protein